MSNSGDVAKTPPDGDAGRDEWAPTRALAAQPGSLDKWESSNALISSRRETEDWAPARSRSGGPDSPDAWQQTRAQTALATQLLNDEHEYLASSRDEIGRHIGGNEHELFVSSDPANALQQQFEHLHPEFIAVHDIATSSSRKLLAGIAAASGRSVQKLVIRRQGFGTALAMLEFVDLPTADGQALRLYSTEADADTASRHALARTLLGYSRLGVVLVGELPGHAIPAALKPLHDDMIAGPWSNRNVLFLPLASASTLVSHVLDLGRGTNITVRTTPQVSRPADAWAFISGTWGRMGDQTRADGRKVPELGPFAPSAYVPRRPPPDASISAGISGADGRSPDAVRPIVLTMRPMPVIDGSIDSVTRPAGPASVLDRYVKQLGDLTGMVSCCVFEIGSGRSVAYAGTSPNAGDLAMHGHELLAAMMTTSRTLGFGHLLPEAAITLNSHHLLLRAIPKHPGLALHAVLDKSSSNLTLARLQVLRMDSLFEQLTPN